MLTNKESLSAQEAEKTTLYDNENLALQTASASGFSRIANKHKSNEAELTVTNFINGIEIPKEQLAQLAISNPVIDRLIASVNNKKQE